MALQSLNLGTNPDDGTGDTLRIGGDKINDNFSEIYTLLGTGNEFTSGLSATATVVTLSSAVGTFTTLTPAAADGTALGSASLEWSDLFLADGAVINLGSDQDVTLTHVADTGILLNSTRQLQFGDSGTYIHQSADGVLDLVSDTEIEINATTIDINGNADVSGTVTFGSITDGAITVTAFVDEDNMSSDSATLIPTQQSVKAYVDSEIASSASSFVLEDDDGTEVTVSDSKEVKFIGAGITTNWTDTDNGTDGDPYDLTFTVDAAQTGITSIKNTSLVVGRDDDNLIKFGTDDQIIFEVSGGDNVIFKASGEIEASSLDISGDVDVDGTLETDAFSIDGTVVTSTAAELNILDGVTSTAAELNILDGVTSTAAELNILDGVTSTAAELNILDGVTSTAAELNYLDISALGTTQASKAVTTDSNGDVLFPDGDKVRLGAGADLILQHDGSHSYIQNSTGNLTLQGKAGEDSIVLAPDGAVTLYHDNAAKLATAAGGVTVTGTLTATTLSGAISGNISQLTNDSGYVTSSGVTSVATGNGLTGGTITTSGTLSMSGSYSGDFSATGNITAYSSDSRLKDFKGKIDNPLDKIEKLNGYYYEWNDTAKNIDPDVFKEGLEVGVNAQEVEAVLPEVITEAPIVEIHKLDTDYKTVYYDKIVPLLIEGIKELKKEIEELKSKGSA
jgi:hypothetical protein